MKKKKLAFICQAGLDTFIEPIVQQFELIDQYQVHRYYCNTQADIIAAVKWADIVWLEWANEIAIFATQIYDLRKKGVIVRLHSYESLGNMPQQIDWTVVDYLVFVAPHIREIVKMNIPDIEKKVCTKVVYNGVDIDKIQPNKVLNPLDIAYVCNINHKKEPALALQIMAELVKVDPEYKLHIAGEFQDNRYKIYMKHIAKEMGIEDNILYYGFVHEMDTFWECKGIILSTSIHEGHALNIIEGASRGLRPVIHNFMGAKELYPQTCLYNTVLEAVYLISGSHANIHPEIKDYVIDRGWTLETQIHKFKALIDKAGKKGKP